MLALHTETVSEATLPLVTSQRLLAADHNRMVQDLSSIANLIGFTDRTDEPHVLAIRAANARPIRKAQLSWMVPRFIFATAPLCDRAREAILNFKNNLPYQYEEHRNISEAQEHLAAQALEYAEMVDLENYQAYRTKDNSDEIAIVHVSPTAAKPENVARAEEASKYLRQTSLWTWASKYFEEKMLGDTFTVETAITLARETDAGDLFEHSGNENDDGRLGMRRHVKVGIGRTPVLQCWFYHAAIASVCCVPNESNEKSRHGMSDLDSTCAHRSYAQSLEKGSVEPLLNP